MLGFAERALDRLVAIDLGIELEFLVSLGIGVVLFAEVLGGLGAFLSQDGGGPRRLLDPNHGLRPWVFLRSSSDSSIRAIVLACSKDSPVGIGPS
jgi:hypothetical protein